MMLFLISMLLIASSVYCTPIDPCEHKRCEKDEMCVEGKCRRIGTRMKCGENMQYSPCGTACPATCGIDKHEGCTFNCVRGCFCLDGFILARDGSSCIPISQCRPSRDTGKLCALNEELKECGLAMEPTCEMPNPRLFTLRCFKKNVCQCRDGFLRHSNGQCVAQEKCI